MSVSDSRSFKPGKIFANLTSVAAETRNPYDLFVQAPKHPSHALSNKQTCAINIIVEELARQLNNDEKIESVNENVSDIYQKRGEKRRKSS